MKILYFYWNEYNGTDCQQALTALGHQLQVASYPIKNYDEDTVFEEAFTKMLSAGFDCVFSFNYFPILSACCEAAGVPYISWVFDCPHLTLQSKTIRNSVNHVYLFDRTLAGRLQSQGISPVRHCPLAVNSQRLDQLCKKLDSPSGITYRHEVSFLGNLYDNEFNFYDSIQSLPPGVKGRVDSIIEAQTHIFGSDFFSDPYIFPDSLMEELQRYIKFEQTGLYDFDYENIITDMFRKKVTVLERRRILTALGKQFPVAFYSTPDAKPIENVPNLGIADYMTEMPAVFHQSRISLNITLRTIISGMSLRCLDVLASGGFLLSDYKEELAENFIEGVDIEFYRTAEELQEKTVWYLSHEDAGKAIALNGMEKCRRNYDYREVLPAILKI